MRGKGMRVNPRVFTVATAREDLVKALIEIDKKYELTPSETLLILSQEMRLLAENCVRSERGDHESEEQGQGPEEA